MELNKYNQGDIVYHKASGQKGVIEEAITFCANPAHKVGIHCIMDGKNCCMKFSGAYNISTGFNLTTTSEEYLLTLVPPDTKPTASDDAARTKLNGGEGL
jgi:hypothetical protein